MSQKQKPKLPLPSYVVLQKMIWNKRKFWPPRIVKGVLEYDIVSLPSWAADVFNHTGCITNEEKFRKGMLVHPDSIKI